MPRKRIGAMYLRRLSVSMRVRWTRESTIGGCSSQASCSTTSCDDASDTSEPAMSEVSVQHSIMEHANQSIQNAFSVNNGQLVGGDGTLNQLELLPFHWPLAKLTLPLKFGVNRLDGLVVGFLMELWPRSRNLGDVDDKSVPSPKPSLFELQHILPKILLRCFVLFCSIRLWLSRMMIPSPS